MVPYKFNTTIQRSELMKKIKGVDTIPEIMFRKALWAKGIRYRKNNRKLPGKPDISIRKYKIVVFIDGEFWHGYKWRQKKKKIKANRKYWIPKIEKNIKRDKENNRLLKKEGWYVFRFWEQEIRKNFVDCLSRVISEVKKRT